MNAPWCPLDASRLNKWFGWWSFSQYDWSLSFVKVGCIFDDCLIESRPSSLFTEDRRMPILPPEEDSFRADVSKQQSMSPRILWMFWFEGASYFASDFVNPINAQIQYSFQWVLSPYSLAERVEFHIAASTGGESFSIFLTSALELHFWNEREMLSACRLKSQKFRNSERRREIFYNHMSLPGEPENFGMLNESFSRIGKDPKGSPKPTIPLVVSNRS